MVRAGTIAALLTFVVLVERFCVETFVVRALPWNNAYFEELIDYVTICITLLVVAVPEGLPLAVVLALAVSIKVHQLTVGRARSSIFRNPTQPKIFTFRRVRPVGGTGWMSDNCSVWLSSSEYGTGCDIMFRRVCQVAVYQLNVSQLECWVELVRMRQRG